MGEYSWRDFIAALTAASLVAGMFLAWIRWQLSSDFARKADIETLGGRIGKIETQMQGAPTHADMRQLSDRIAAVEKGVEVAGAQIQGVREGVARVDVGVQMLIQHHMGTADK
jgi:hypothetical protein